MIKQMKNRNSDQDEDLLDEQLQEPMNIASMFANDVSSSLSNAGVQFKPWEER